MDEFHQYGVLKGAVRSKLTRKPSRPNIDKIKKEIRGEVEKVLKKNTSPRRHFELKFVKFDYGFQLSVTRDIA